MRVIVPLVITPALLVSSNVPEPDASMGEVVWAAGAFAKGDKRIVVSTHRIYEALADIAASTVSPDLDPTQWQDIGPTNRWAMFALDRNTQTVLASPLIVVIAPGKRVDAFALTGLDATGETVEMDTGGPPVYTYTESLVTRITTTWSDYFFGEFGSKSSSVRFDLPPVTGAEITITLTNGSGPVKCAACVIGNSFDIGSAELGAESLALNFSEIKREFDGSLSTLIPRRTVPKTTQNILLPKSEVNKTRYLRSKLNASPAVWSTLGDNNEDGYFEALLILGVYKEWTINMAHPEHAKITLELEEI
jgi:hypothetical protein